MHATIAVRTAVVIVVVAAAASALAGCSDSSTTDPTATTVRTVAASPSAASPSAASPSASSPSSAPSSPTATPMPTCGPSSGASAAAGPIARLPLPAALPSARWDPSTADASTYDGCAALSAVTVTLAGSTASSPVAVLLFHDGTYLGTATKEQYSFEPQVTRTAPDAIRVVYSYTVGRDTDADPSGRATATYTWDDAAGRVVLSGDVPPTS